MLYFFLDNSSLHLFSRNSSKSISSIAKLNLSKKLLLNINDSKVINEIISDAFKRASDKIDLKENSKAVIILSDDILFHSVHRLNTSNPSQISMKIEEELELKWGKLYNNLFTVYETAKTSQSIIHSVSINHFLREKIKLNLNNNGLSLKQLIPISSIIIDEINTSQIAYINRNQNEIDIIFSNRSGFHYNRLKKEKSGFKRLRNVGSTLIDIKSDDFMKSSTKFIEFNYTKIVEILNSKELESFPILDFSNPKGLQFLKGQMYKKSVEYNPSKNKSLYLSILKNFIAFMVTILFLSQLLKTINDRGFDLDEFSSEEITSFQEVDIVNSTENFALISSQDIIYNFQRMITIEQIDSIQIMNSELLVNNISQDFLSSNTGIINEINKIDLSNLLQSAIEIDSSVNFKVMESTFLSNPSRNIILRFSSIEDGYIFLENIKFFSNIFLKKITFNKDDLLHIYLIYIVE